MKTISLITRKHDLSPATFQRYYEDTHCWLGMKHFPFTRYTRNHLVAGSVDLGFDCVSEFGMAPDFNGGDIMNSRSRGLMLEDELKFMDPERIRVARVREQTLLGTANAAADAGFIRYLLLFQRTSITQEDYPTEVEATAKALLTDLSGIHHASLDLRVSRGSSGFPYDALLWLTMSEGADEALPQQGDLPGLVAVVAVTTHATPEATLRQHFEAYLP